MGFEDLGKVFGAIGGGIILIVVGLAFIATQGVQPPWLMPSMGIPFIGGGIVVFLLLATGKIT